jgi:hypothetical protein
MSLIFGLLMSLTALSIQKLAATTGKAAFLLPEIVTSHFRLGEYDILNIESVNGVKS